MKPEDLPESPIKACHDYVVLLRMEDKSKGNLITTVGKSGDPRYECFVVDVGPGRVTDTILPDGTPHIVKPTVKRGDKVVFNAPHCQPMEVYGYMFVICPMFQVFGVTDDIAMAWLEKNQVANVLTSKSKIHG